MSSSTTLGAGAWIPQGTEPNSVIRQPIRISLSTLLVGQIQPLNIYVLVNSVFGTCSQKAKVTCLQTVCRSRCVKSEMKEDGSLNLMSYRLYQVINVLLVPQLRLQTD
jgi:hypothetical protein